MMANVKNSSGTTQLVHEQLACRKGSVSRSIKNFSSIFRSIIKNK